MSGTATDVLVHLDMHTYTPHQLLIRAHNLSDVCSQNQQNSQSNSKATVISKRKASTGGVNADLPSPVWRYCGRIYMCILFHYGYIHTIEFSAYLFIHLNWQCLCSGFIYVR